MKKIHFRNHEELSSFLNSALNVAREYGRVSILDADALLGRPGFKQDDALVWSQTDLMLATIEGGNGDYILVLPDPKKIDVEDEEDEMVSHPPHYQSETGLEVIDVIEAFTFDLAGIEATDTGNIIKYACRWKKKGGVQDLKKIVWYANHLINHIEKLEKEN